MKPIMPFADHVRQHGAFMRYRQRDRNMADVEARPWFRTAARLMEYVNPSREYVRATRLLPFATWLAFVETGEPPPVSGPPRHSAIYLRKIVPICPISEQGILCSTHNRRFSFGNTRLNLARGSSIVHTSGGP